MKQNIIKSDQYENPLNQKLNGEEIIQFSQPYQSLAFSNNDQSIRLALGSNMQNSNNQIDIYEYNHFKQKHEAKGYIKTQLPVSKILFIPNPSSNDLLAFSNHSLQIWEMDSINYHLKHDLTKDHSFEETICSFDWNKINLNHIVTSSSNSMTEIWDIEKQTIIYKISEAHESQVYDICFLENKTDMVSVGADGRCLILDSRTPDECVLIYQEKKNLGIFKVCPNPQSPNILALISIGQNYITMVDSRYPNQYFNKLIFHKEPVSSIEWIPYLNNHLCSASYDGKAIIWDLAECKSEKFIDPSYILDKNDPILKMTWSKLSRKLALLFNQKLQITKNAL